MNMASNTYWRFGALVGFLELACASARNEPPEQPAASQDPCADADVAIKKVWSSETKVEVRAQVMSWGGEVGTEVAEQKAFQIDSSMDSLSEDWVRMRTAVCNDRFKRHTISDAEYQSRADCLDELLTRQRSFLNSLSSPHADLTGQLTAMNDALQSCRSRR